MSLMECHHSRLAVAPGREPEVQPLSKVIADLYLRRDQAVAAGLQDEAERTRRNLAVLLGEKADG